MDKYSYTITDKAGDWLAGKRRQPDQTTILLTEAEAEFELRAGTIVPVVDASPAPEIVAAAPAPIAEPAADPAGIDATAIDADGAGRRRSKLL